MSGILDAITQKPLVAAVVVISLAAAGILKYALRRSKRSPKARPQNRPRSKRRR
jgi:hypothetical protein